MAVAIFRPYQFQVEGERYIKILKILKVLP